MDAQKREASSPKPLPCRTYSIGDRIRDPGAVPESVFWRTNDEGLFNTDFLTHFNTFNCRQGKKSISGDLHTKPCG